MPSKTKRIIVETATMLALYFSFVIIFITIRLMCGVGKMRFANGTEYKGQFENGMANGLGFLKLVNGDKYEGNFKTLKSITKTETEINNLFKEKKLITKCI
jgi:hypothetical protein